MYRERELWMSSSPFNLKINIFSVEFKRRRRKATWSDGGPKSSVIFSFLFIFQLGEKKKKRMTAAQPSARASPNRTATTAQQTYRMCRTRKSFYRPTKETTTSYRRRSHNKKAKVQRPGWPEKCILDYPPL
jgi:hypothetical protein